MGPPRTQSGTYAGMTRSPTEALGVKLFQRTPTGLVLGESGQVLHAHAERVEAEVLASERELTGADRRVSGPVRLTAGDGMATHVLAPRLAELQRAHPELRVELRADNLAVDLSRREADVALRLFRPREQSLIARRLAPFTFGVYGGEPYFARRGRPSGMKDAARHDWLGPESAQDGTPPGQWLRRHIPAARVVLRSSATTVLMSACAAGQGLAVFPELLAASDPRLVPVLPRALHKTASKRNLGGSLTRWKGIPRPSWPPAMRSAQRSRSVLPSSVGCGRRFRRQHLVQLLHGNGENDSVAHRLNEPTRDFQCSRMEERPRRAKLLGGRTAQLHLKRFDLPRLAVNEEDGYKDGRTVEGVGWCRGAEEGR
ncbi:LysR substrate-binding domain-containing protein [Archangium sp.]|uniref:LysR substrate-binding domain-containing protein n=1 Tax=Archangium sp. TaxID=1872627 RepID=UPI002D29C5BB|nr:LysR substrate-binding domain-containing protein [Archangium sp.]HYO54097.1 LysR substrate-binding domain-containing protein [Archangium sp.]